MPANEIHKSDIGTVFKVTIKDSASAVDISTATTKQIIFKKPGGGKLTKDAPFFTDGSDGIITYTTVSGDLSEEGMWKLQGYIVLSGGNTFYTDIYTFKVYRNL
tara:strand:- start:5323 stop:5634 length:312 start_codon:yes stop_codon:yes gene_type:complete